MIEGGAWAGIIAYILVLVIGCIVGGINDNLKRLKKEVEELKEKFKS